MSLIDETPEATADQTDTTGETPVPVADQKTQLIYCGPNLPRSVLNQFTVYQNGLPKHLDPHLEACPAIRRLFVPIESFSKTMASIAQKGTPENVWFRQIIEYFTGGAKA